MHELTAQEARAIAKQSKVETIYGRIIEAAKAGEYKLSVEYITESAFKSLIANGYKIFIKEGEEELTQYHRETMTGYTFYEINWKK